MSASCIGELRDSVVAAVKDREDGTYEATWRSKQSGNYEVHIFIDDVPMVPGPPDLEGPLRLAIRADAGTDAVIRRIDVIGPSETESRVIDEWRSTVVDPGR